MTVFVDARPVMTRIIKSSFTISVDGAFTSSREVAFTNESYCAVKTPAIA